MLFNWKLFPGTNLQDLNLDWIINFVKMIPSRLPKFSNHHTWLVYDYSTGEYYDSGEPTGGAGEPGEPGKSPIIGTNGNWYVYNNDVGGYVDTGTRAQGVQGEPGAGVASGGAAGDVLVKASGVDYNTGWTATPPQMGVIAHINAGNSADKPYESGEYLVYNGLLYKVGNTAIGQGETLTPGSNINAVNNGGINDLYDAIKGIFTIKTLSVNHGSINAGAASTTEVPNINKPLYIIGYAISGTYNSDIIPWAYWWSYDQYKFVSRVKNTGANTATDITVTYYYFEL